MKANFVNSTNFLQIFNHTNDNLVIDKTKESYTYKNDETAWLIRVICRPMLIVFGTIGNLLAFYILRRGSLKNTSTCFYMAILALADTGMLWAGAFNGWLRYITHGKVNIDALTKCKVAMPIYYFCGGFSSVLLIIMSIEKFLALYFPLGTKRLCTVAIAKRISGVTAILYAVYNSQVYYIYEASNDEEGNSVCLRVRISDSYFKTHVAMSSILYSFLPFAVMSITNCAIIYKLLSAKCRRKKTNQALSKSATKGTAMLITVSIVFILLTGPVAITYSVNDTPPQLVQAIVFTLQYLNHSINGVLYCVAGSKFRKELLRLFRSCRRNKVDNLSHTAETSATAIQEGETET